MNSYAWFYYLIAASSPIAAQLRDPFSYGGDFHLLACVGIGCINNQVYGARIYDDGLFTLLKLHDIYYNSEVVRISLESVTFKERKGLEHHLVVTAAKSPST